jgi:hypothetical protein
MKKPLIILCFITVAILVINCKKDTFTPILATIQIYSDSSNIYVGKTLQFKAIGKDQNRDGIVISPSPTWSVSGGGTISQTGLFTATTEGGPFTVSATVGSVVGTAKVTVKVELLLTTITVTPATEKSIIGTGRTLKFIAKGKDQFGKDMIILPKPIWSATGGTIDTSGLFKAGTIQGNFMVKAQSKLISDSALVTLIYGGIPYIDSLNKIYTPITIPGKLECEFYDKGGEGVTYHDSDPQNNGSGNLNTGGGYYADFRKKEAADISYTKFEGQDNSAYNKVIPLPYQLYIGWTEPGEWLKYSVDVTESGNYQIGVMYTSNRGGTIRFYIDDTDMTSILNIPTTYDANDLTAWRQWHHWNRVDSLTTQHIDMGRRLIKLKIETMGNFNFDYFLFTKVN